MKKIIITIMLTLLVLSNISPSTIVAMNDYRNPLTLITWSTGIVMDDKGNGVETTPFHDSWFNYISYKGNGIPEGEEVFTIFVYNPLTLYGDDYIARFDF